MFKKKKDKELDYEAINTMLHYGNKIVKIGVFLAIIVGIYVFTLIFREWQIKKILLTLISILLPLIIGFLIAWLFAPVIAWFKKQGFSRAISTAITYIILISILSLIIGTLIPLLIEQMTELGKQMPSVVNSFNSFVDTLFNKLSDIPQLNVESLKTGIFSKFEMIVSSFTEDLPALSINFVKIIFSGLGTFVIGLIIGFFLLVSMDEPVNTLSIYVPFKYRDDVIELIKRVNESFRLFIKGALFDSTLIFVISSIAFFFVGLKAPVLFGLFCGLTNVIPYAGPYIGGIPAIVVGFSQSPTIGILVLLVIAVIQFIEGNFFQPLIMSKSTKLHPVTIIVGLLVFGHYAGIVGMFISTPIIAGLKAIFEYFDSKYNFFNV